MNKKERSESVLKKHRIIEVIVLVIAIVVTAAAYYLIMRSPYGNKELKIYNNGFGMLDMKRHYSGSFALQMIQDIGSPGRSVYLRILSLDLFFALGFAVVQSRFVKLLIFLLRMDKKFEKLMYICYIRAVLDLTEDALLSFALRHYATVSPNLLNFTSVITSIKWIAMALAFLSPFIVKFILILKKLLKG
ncbi:hypothetical protein [Anaeromicropila populeti]|uniref:Uncharacterized protein n=1 Tax=Anaeromicropila populeti TaxID=37658 RepID=A0A1I6J0A1_9FIRM|nr:hypothetical protein [Anaeromicropila populeti]SFR72301.1 hypothetical protein SAMN05661086_01303 [Anaeromicropila populeti]